MKRRSAPPRRAEPEDTYFLNVDLDVFARSSLEPLAAAFGSRVFRLYVGPQGSSYGAHFELRPHRKSADALIARLVRLVTDLPRPARVNWNRAFRRDFNIGIQAGFKPFSYELALKPETLKLVSSVNGRVVVTIYAAEDTRKRAPQRSSSGSSTR